MKVSELFQSSVFIERLLRASQCWAFWIRRWVRHEPYCWRIRTPKG